MKPMPCRVKLFWLVYLAVLITFIFLAACSTANNWKMPPYEVKRVELTCDRTTHGLPSGLVCMCRQFGSTWDCQVMRTN